MTFIVLEGPNGGGKSTVAAALKPHMLLKAGPPTHTTAYEEWVAPLIQYADLPFTNLVVADRWHLGEAVYPALLMPPRLRLCSNLELTQISKTIAAIVPNAMIVYVMPPIAELARRFAARDGGTHWQVEYGQAEEAHGRYLEVISDRLHANCPHRILSSQQSVDQFIETYGTDTKDEVAD